MVKKTFLLLTANNQEILSELQLNICGLPPSSDIFRTFTSKWNFETSNSSKFCVQWILGWSFGRINHNHKRVSEWHIFFIIRTGMEIQSISAQNTPSNSIIIKYIYSQQSKDVWTFTGLCYWCWYRVSNYSFVWQRNLRGRISWGGTDHIK